MWGWFMDNDKLRESLAQMHNQMASLQDLQHELNVAVLANVTQVKIVQELLKGRRTVARLVEELDGLRKGDPDYSTCYSRVRKETKDLENRAIVSRRMFGRDRPYSLTQLGMERLTQLRGFRTPGILSLPDALTYTAALVLGAVCAAIIIAGTGTGLLITLLAFVFVFIGGSAFSRIFRAVSRIRPISMPGDLEGITKQGRGGESRRMWKPFRKQVADARRWTAMSMTTKVIGYGVLFGAVFLVLGSVALLGVSEGDRPTYLGIPSDEDAEIPSSGGRFRLDMTAEEFQAEFRLTDQETEQLAILIEERDSLQSQVDEKLGGIRELVGPGVHRLNAKKLSKQFDLDEEETTKLDTLIEEWMRLASELRDKTEEIMDFLTGAGVWSMWRPE